MKWRGRRGCSEIGAISRKVESSVGIGCGSAMGRGRQLDAGMRKTGIRGGLAARRDLEWRGKAGHGAGMGRTVVENGR